jgi:hypothetical protein
MTDAVTKADLLATKTELKNELATKAQLHDLRVELVATRAELKEEIRFLGARFDNLESIVKAFGEGLLGVREHVHGRDSRASEGARHANHAARGGRAKQFP